MGTFNNIFKIILVIQLLTCALAFYGHPDAETIDFGSPTQPSRDQMIIEAAIKRGMDGEAVAELLRTKQPVTRTTTTPNGLTKKTTYKLEPDGSISSKSLITQRKSYVYNSENVPDTIPIDDLRNSPTGTITRTYTDSDGSKVTQTIGLSKPKPSTVLDTDDLSGDWFSKPFPSWPEEKPAVAQTPTRTSHRTITRTYTGPNGEKRTVTTWSSDPEITQPETQYTPVQHTPSNFNTRTNTRTYYTPTSHSPQPSDFNHKPKFPSIGDINWPTIGDPAFGQPWETADPEDSEDGWEVIEDPEVETTTKKQFQSWTPKSWDWPEFPTHPTTTTSTTSTSTTTTTVKTPTHKPLPNLDDFLKSQYGPSNRNAPTTTTTTAKVPTTSNTTQKPKVINIDDLPVVEVFHNGKPANESILKTLPPHLTPRPLTDNVLKIEHKHPIDEDVEVYTPKVEKNIRTFSKTHIGHEKPSIQDLDPQMQEVLRRAGISPDDITNIEGDTITKTRTEPDGRVITTTYKVNSVPSPAAQEPQPPVQQHQYKPQTPQFATHTYNSYKPVSVPEFSPLAPFLPQLSPISEFLAKLGLTKFDITSRNGQYTKTFIDENGEVLTATFVLSSPKSLGSVEQPRPKPYK